MGPNVLFKRLGCNTSPLHTSTQNFTVIFWSFCVPVLNHHIYNEKFVRFVKNSKCFRKKSAFVSLTACIRCQNSSKSNLPSWKNTRNDAMDCLDEPGFRWCFCLLWEMFCFLKSNLTQLRPKIKTVVLESKRWRVSRRLGGT